MHHRPTKKKESSSKKKYEWGKKGERGLRGDPGSAAKCDNICGGNMCSQKMLEYAFNYFGLKFKEYIFEIG